MVEVYQGEGELIPSDGGLRSGDVRSLSGGRRTDSQQDGVERAASAKSIRGKEN